MHQESGWQRQSSKIFNRVSPSDHFRVTSDNTTGAGDQLRRCGSDPGPQPGRQWIGLYYLHEIEMPEPNTVWFMTGDSIADPVGLEYRAGENGSTFGFPGWYEVEW